MFGFYVNIYENYLWVFLNGIRCLYTFMNSAAENKNNCSVCDKNVKFGTLIVKDTPKRNGGIMHFSMEPMEAILKNRKQLFYK